MLRYLIALFLLIPAECLAQGASSTGPRALPTPEQRAWQDLGVGMFIHFAPNTWRDMEYDDNTVPLAEINPDKLDTDQWVDTALAMGAKYIVFVAKHAGGFCMWRTATTDYGIAHTPWRGGNGDVMADLARSCAKKGMKLGVYLSPQDKKHGAGTGGRCETAEKQKAYDALYRAQLTELLSNYGPVVEVWFDGSQVVPVGDILKKHAPGAMIFQGPHATIRWVGNEMGFAPYPAWNGVSARDAATGIATAIHGDPDGERWLPNEVDVSLRRPNWFWSTKNHTRIMSLDELMEIYYRSVGRGANLLLNLTPDTSGLIPAADVARAREFGDEVRKRFGTSVAETHGTGKVVTLKLPRPMNVDHVIIQEDIGGGERVREYSLEGLSEGKWVPLGGGTAIGQMRIQPVGPSTVETLRLTCARSVGTPSIRKFAAFATGAAPPKTWNDPAEMWADDEAGRWVDGRLDMDISKKIDAAAQYRLRFVGESGAKVELSGVEVYLGGIAQPHLIRPEKGRADAFILTVPGLGQTVRLKAVVRGAASGVVLLRKM